MASVSYGAQLESGRVWERMGIFHDIWLWVKMKTLRDHRFWLIFPFSSRVFWVFLFPVGFFGYLYLTHCHMDWAVGTASGNLWDDLDVFLMLWKLCGAHFLAEKQGIKSLAAKDLVWGSRSSKGSIGSCVASTGCEDDEVEEKW